MNRALNALVAVTFGLAMLALPDDVASAAPAPATHAAIAVQAPSSAITQPGLRPLTIQTIPAVSGAQFALDGRVLVTGKDGSVRTTITKAQRDDLALARDAHLTVASPNVDVHPGVRAQFAGWYDGGYHFDKSNASGQLLLAAFDFSYLTSFTFVDGSGALVRSTPLHDLQLHATSGATVTVSDPTRPLWLRGLHVSSNAGHLAVDDLSYTISSVMAKGSNVVRSGEQRFRPSRASEVTVRSLFFTVQFRAHDALFGRTTGSTLALRSADGSVLRLPLHNGAVTVQQLPRGAYQLEARAFGLNQRRSVSISRNQTVRIPIFTALDVAAVAVAVLAIAAAVVMLARSRRHGRLAATAGPGIDLTPGSLEA